MITTFSLEKATLYEKYRLPYAREAVDDADHFVRFEAINREVFDAFALAGKIRIDYEICVSFGRPLQLSFCNINVATSVNGRSAQSTPSLSLKLST